MRMAMGIVRVSRRAGREGDSFVSPTDQAKRIREACERDGLELAGIAEEIEISGGTPLKKRQRLLEAVEAVEAGRINVVVVAYFDRLVRSLRVQGEVVSRVEAAGGQVLTVDVGAVSEKTASQWLSGTLLGAVAEYQRRSTAERSADAQANAVARGIVPWPNIPPGYRRGNDGRLAPDRDARTVAKAFKMRAGGSTIREVRTFLRKHGIERSFHGVTVLLESRVVLGEIHFGKLVNLEAHRPIVDRELWRRVQRVKVPKGRRPKSDRLLARLGVLRCGTCGARMVVGTVREGKYPFYRCPPTGDCPQRVTISAAKIERAVADAVRKALANVEGRASVEANAREAERSLELAQDRLDSAIRAFADLGSEAATNETLADLRAARDEAQELVDQLGGADIGGIALPIGSNWDRLTLGERRDFIRAIVKRILIAPGRQPDRIHIELFI